MIFRDYHVDGFGQHFEVEGRVGQSLAFGFKQELMRRYGNDSDLFSLEGSDFLEFVDEAAVVEVFHVGGEFDQPNFLDGSNVKQVVVGNGIRHHHHAAAVESTVAYGKTHDLVVEHHRSINYDLYMKAFERQDAMDGAEQITEGTSFSFRLQQIGLAAYHFVQPCAGGIKEITHFGIAVVVVSYLADIMLKPMVVLDDPYVFPIIDVEAKGASPIVAGAHGNDAHGYLI